jgi:hypothetical protein
MPSPSPDPSSPAAEPETPGGLGEEIALLDRVRQALAKSEQNLALQSLAEYEREFAQGILRAEAAALRVEILFARGDEKEALELAERFFSSYPESPLTRRVRRLVRDKKIP